MKLIVGLGNPGKDYINTRHNIGFMVLDNYLKNITWSKKFNSLYYIDTINGEKVIFLKPQCYMNLSGQEVRKFMDYFKISIEDILIIHDDLDLEVGTLRLKYSSSSGGHNGIKSIIECLGSKDFIRLKIGISKNTKNIVDYVLSSFSREEINVIIDKYSLLNEIINDFIKNENYLSLMNKYN